MSAVPVIIDVMRSPCDRMKSEKHTFRNKHPRHHVGFGIPQRHSYEIGRIRGDSLSDRVFIRDFFLCSRRAATKTN